MKAAAQGADAITTATAAGEMGVGLSPLPLAAYAAPPASPPGSSLGSPVGPAGVRRRCSGPPPLPGPAGVASCSSEPLWCSGPWWGLRRGRPRSGPSPFESPGGSFSVALGGPGAAGPAALRALGPSPPLSLRLGRRLPPPPSLCPRVWGPPGVVLGLARFAGGAGGLPVPGRFGPWPLSSPWAVPAPPASLRFALGGCRRPPSTECDCRGMDTARFLPAVWLPQWLLLPLG